MMFQMIFLLTSIQWICEAAIRPATPSYPSCYTEDTTWSLQEAIQVIPGVNGLWSCQDLCLHSEHCNRFTWYSPEGVPMDLGCFLFDHPTTEYPCRNCVSGPPTCLCSENFSCQITDDNFLGQIADVELEVLCQEHCLQTEQCNFYTWFSEDSSQYPNDCFMFSSCQEQDFTCSFCHTGPGVCPNTCEAPGLPEHGEWFCPPPGDSIACHLECHPGFVPNNTTVITCIDGEWSPIPSCVTPIGLIAGNSHTPENSVEIYGLGVHESLPALPDDRDGHVLHLTGSSVILCGGLLTRTSCIRLSTSQEWIPHSTTTSERYLHSSVFMLGQLHLLGGEISPTTTEYLDSSTITKWSQGWDLNEETEDSCAAKIGPEEFLITGGHFHPESVISYNVTSGRATRLQNIITPRYRHGCIPLRDSDTGSRSILVAGGSGRGSSFDQVSVLNSSEIYDVETGEWSEGGQLSIGRNAVRMVVLGEFILAMGGGYFDEEDGSYIILSSVDSFNTTSRKWSPTEDMIEERWFHAVVGVPPNFVGFGSTQ